MTHAYSVDIHNYINNRLTVAEEKRKSAQKEKNFETDQYYEGQIKELLMIREFLSETIDLKTQKYY